MKVFSLPLPATGISREDAELASMLRNLAFEVERGKVDHLMVTLIRHDRTIERLGNVPTVTKIS